MNQNTPTVFLQITPSDIRDFEKSRSFLRRPELIGYYSYNYDNCTPAEYTKYFRQPERTEYPLNLNEGFSTFRFPVPSKVESRLHLPLNYAMSSAKQNVGGLSKEHSASDTTNVYTSRRVITKLMEWCYAKYDFKIFVSRYNDDIFIASELRSDIAKNPEGTHHKILEHLLFTGITRLIVSRKYLFDFRILCYTEKIKLKFFKSFYIKTAYTH